LSVEPDAEVVQRHPRRQASPRTAQLMRTIPVKAEGIEELVVDALHDLANGGHPPPEPLGPAPPATVSLWGMDDSRSIAFEPPPVVLDSFETLVRHVASRGGPPHAGKPQVRVAPGGEEGLGHRLVGGGGGRETEACDDARGAHGDQQPEALVPSQSVGPSDVGVAREPPRASALGVPDATIAALSRAS
jgi:hypothetical protein